MHPIDVILYSCTSRQNS